MYLMLLASNSTAEKDTKVPGGPAVLNPDGSVTRPPPATTVTTTVTIEATPRIKRKIAEMANGFASVIVPYLQANAVAYVTNDATMDGIFRDSTTANCLHPTTVKTIPIR